MAFIKCVNHRGIGESVHVRITIFIFSDSESVHNFQNQFLQNILFSLSIVSPAHNSAVKNAEGRCSNTNRDFLFLFCGSERNTFSSYYA